jgi:UDP:flavonoid glycosyltransferase YjiC (YdhE family)
MLGALAYGLPQLILPQGADQFDNAALIDGLGAGLFLPPEEATVDAIRDVARRLLIEPTFLAAAIDIQRDIEDMPTVIDAVATVEEFVLRTAR